MFLSLQTSNSPTSAWPSPSKVAATETMQPFSRGSFTVTFALGFKGFEVLAVLSSALMTTSVAVLALAFVTMTAEAGVGPRFFGLAAARAGPRRDRPRQGAGRAGRRGPRRSARRR